MRATQLKIHASSACSATWLWLKTMCFRGSMPAAMKAAVALYPNARFLDYAAYVDSVQVPYMPDGSHPNPKGMGMRANWIASQLR